MNETKLAIKIKDIKKSYDETAALKGVSFEVTTGEMYGLIGPDGAGKTTLMRILTSLLDADSGDAIILGISVKDYPEQVRKVIGYMPQRFSLYQDLTVQENMRFFADLFKVPKKERLERTEELLNFSRMAPFVKRRAVQLSGGMKQKLALSCALIHTPQLLILDEPTTGVDPVSRKEFWTILSRLRSEGVTILVSTPYMDEAARCDRVALIHKGEILAIGKDEEIAGLFPGKVGAMTGPDLPGLAGWLKRRLRTDRVQILGDRVKISLLDREADQLESLAKEAQHKGFQVDSAQIIEPELEDTFVAMMSERGAGDELEPEMKNETK